MDEGQRIRGKIHELVEQYYRHADVGTLSQSALYENLGALVGRTATTVEAEINSYLQINTEVVRVIEMLHRDYKIGLCSNAPVGYVQHIMREHDLLQYFDAITISSDVGCRKPDPCIFVKALDALGVPVEEAVFVDDNPQYTEAATAFGITSVHFEDATQMVGEFTHLGFM